ncbi:MAG: hypothetical protein CO141_01100 [Candidatus Moranbacteria bacterium CG_4_9_14_3_um_filter_42_9]|nr:MAG: hypothetical protein CO141_01100 [Candidatus Moranbacteria bacterium CG_4_9_14_3_um_filter_42_9]
MKPIKGSIAEKKGIKFSGNPDFRDRCEKPCRCSNPSPGMGSGFVQGGRQITLCLNCNGQISLPIR